MPLSPFPAPAIASARRHSGTPKSTSNSAPSAAPPNSGVYIQDRYEANINETYGSLTANPNGQFDNSVPGKPGIRASRPVLEWQTFDIDFKAPRFDASGKKTADGVVTLLLNGEVIYKDQPLGPVILNASEAG